VEEIVGKGIELKMIEGFGKSLSRERRRGRS
jgi:hypothetical protein